MTPKDGVLRLLGLWAAAFFMRVGASGADPSTLIETRAAFGWLTGDVWIPTSGSAWVLAFVARWSGGPITLEHVAWTASWLGPLLGGAVAPLAYLLCRRERPVQGALVAGVLVFAFPLVSEAASGRPIESALAATAMLAMAVAIVEVHVDPTRLWGPLLLGGVALAVTLNTRPVVALAASGPFLIAGACGSARTARALLRVGAAGVVLDLLLGVLLGGGTSVTSGILAVLLGLTLWNERSDRLIGRDPETAAIVGDGLDLAYGLLALTGWAVSVGAGLAGLFVAVGPRLARFEARLPARGRRSLAWLWAAVLTASVLTSGCLP